MNPNATPSASPAFLARSLWQHRLLIIQLARRDIAGKYRGSAMGVGWSLVTPILMIAVYTFVFSVVFQSRWADAGGGDYHFAIILFIGMIAHALLSEVLNRTPALIQSNVSYVKKVLFPLEILPVVTVASALFHAGMSLLVLLAAMLLSGKGVHWTFVLLVPVLAPLVFLSLGIGWMLASLGTYLRDVGQVTAVVTTLLLFLSPVLFPMSMIPERFHFYIWLNPITFIVNQSRQVAISGGMPDWPGLCLYMLLSLIVLWAGFFWFQRTRKGFSDVL